jgi:hypothetical protein
MISDETLRRVMPASMVALLGQLIRWSAWALVFIIWAAFLQVYVRMIRLTLADPSHSDFTIFYYTARLVADGLPMYGVSPTRYGVPWAADHLGNLNPPHFQLLVLPLGHMSYGAALAVWVLISLTCLTSSVALIVRELNVPFSWPRLWLWGAFTISSAAFTTVAVTCELTFVLMLPFTLAWRAWRGRRWVAAAAWLGACASFKLFLLLFVPWLAWRRQWRALAAFFLCGAAMVAIGVAIFGVGSYGQWLETLGRIGWWWLPLNASWQGFISRILSGGATVAPLISRPDLVRALTVAGSAMIAGLTLIAAARARPDDDRTLLLLFGGAILCSPLGWVYYLPLGYGPILGWMGAGRGWQGLRVLSSAKVGIVAAGLALLYVPHETTYAGQLSGLASVTIGSAYFWGVLCLWMTWLTPRPA